MYRSSSRRFIVFSSGLIGLIQPDSSTRLRLCRTERVTVGSTLPADAELREVPADWGPSASKYRYIYHDNRVRFVDPANRRVIYDID
jgi:Protein of unknown function (DUF1236)